jgi:hypothetical protein
MAGSLPRTERRSARKAAAAKQPSGRSLMRPNSNPNAGSLLAWLHDREVRDGISRLHRNLGFDKKP